MATSKKDYVAIAKILEVEAKPLRDADNDPAQETISALEAVERIAYRLADYFSGDNQLFNKDRFLKACGMPIGKCHCGVCSRCRK